MTSSLEIDERRVGGRLILSLSGELDRASEAELVCRLSRAVHSGADVVVDLRDLEFIDPSGVGTLRRAAASAAHDGWTLAITGAPPHVARVFRLTRADAFLPLRAA